MTADECLAIVKAHMVKHEESGETKSAIALMGAVVEIGRGIVRDRSVSQKVAAWKQRGMTDQTVAKCIQSEVAECLTAINSAVMTEEKNSLA